MKNGSPLPIKAYCINLLDRPERWEAIKKNWEGKMPVERVDAVDMRSTNEGMKGVYASHMKIMFEYMQTSDFDKGLPLLILEDDSVPCSDFKSRLEKFWPLLPIDWQVFLPGFWPTQFADFEPVNEFIHKAKQHVIGNHCWCIKAEFVPAVYQFFANYHNRHLDDVMRSLQLTFNVHIAIPSFAHQNGAFSDTSGEPSYTDPTRTYFKDSL